MRLKDLFGPQKVTVPCPAAWATAATVSEVVAFEAPHDLKITGVKVIPTTAVVGHATNFVGVAVNVGATEAAQKDFSTVTTDDIAAFAAADVTLSATAANRLASAGDIIRIEKTVGGTGESLDGVIEVTYIGN